MDERSGVFTLCSRPQEREERASEDSLRRGEEDWRSFLSRVLYCIPLRPRRQPAVSAVGEVVAVKQVLGISMRTAIYDIRMF